MHKSCDLTIKDISKIEGHASLEVRIRGGKVISAKLKVREGKRFFTQAVRGMPFNSVPQVVSRICGVCSTAHLTCCTEAVEKALGISPSEQTIALRKLSMYAANMRDHAMHLYFFCLPDIFGKDSVLDFEGEEKEWLHEGLHVKGAGNRFAKRIAGRAVHPTNYTVGGFLRLPKRDEVKKTIKELEEVRPMVLKLIDLLYYNSPQYISHNTIFVAMLSKDFSYYGNEVIFSDGRRVPEEDYFNHLKRVIIPYSTATAFKCPEHGLMVGALARMNLYKKNLHRRTKRDVARFLNAFPSTNVFHNLLAQAIEILHYIDASCDMLESMEFVPERPPKPKPRKGTGVGVIEAPRGTLYYMMRIGDDGRINEGTLVIPTQQNLVNMECDIANFIQSNMDKDKEEMRKDVEKLIRAYDPCMSCATHFLRIKWIKEN